MLDQLAGAIMRHDRPQLSSVQVPATARTLCHLLLNQSPMCQQGSVLLGSPYCRWDSMSLRGRELFHCARTEVCAWSGCRCPRSGSGRGQKTRGRPSVLMTSRMSCRQRSKQRCRAASRTSAHLQPGAWLRKHLMAQGGCTCTYRHDLQPAQTRRRSVTASAPVRSGLQCWAQVQG
jgi:hypothetical protein